MGPGLALGRRSQARFLQKSTEHMRKVPTITLSITYKGVKFIDASNKVRSPARSPVPLHPTRTPIPPCTADPAVFPAWAPPSLSPPLEAEGWRARQLPCSRAETPNQPPAPPRPHPGAEEGGEAREPDSRPLSSAEGHRGARGPEHLLRGPGPRGPVHLRLHHQGPAHGPPLLPRLQHGGRGG